LPGSGKFSAHYPFSILIQVSKPAGRKLKMFYYAVVAVHVIVCIILVLVVLLQSGKGADLAGAFGGGGTQTAFGSRGPASFLTRMTTVVAVVFMLTSIGLSMMGERRSAEDKSILETSGRTSSPAQEQKTDTGGASTYVPTPEQIEEQIRQIQENQQAAPADTTPESAPAE
jgi:preprotein translocase subunit SecG